MQRIGFDAIVGLLDTGVGIMDCTNTHLVTTGKTQAGANAVFELERGTQIIGLELGIGECRYPDTRLQVGFDGLPGELVNEYRRKETLWLVDVSSPCQ